MTPQQKEIANKINAEIEAFRSNTKFPGALVHPCFDDWLSEALKHESQQTLECPWPVFKSLFQVGAADFTIQQMGFALNSIESKSREQMNMGEAEYIQMQDYVEETCKKWQGMVEPVKAEIVAKHNKPSIIQSKPKIFKTYGK